MNGNSKVVLLLFDNFDVHEVVPVVANGDAKVHENCVVFTRLEHGNASGRTHRQVDIDTIQLYM